MPLIEYTHPGNPVPFQRPRFNRKTGKVFQSAKYNQYKKRLALGLNAMYGHLQLDWPSLNDTNACRKYKRDNRYQLLVRAFRADHSICDADNLLKAAQDALQDARVIMDDYQIDDARVIKAVDTKNPRLEIVLCEMNEPDYGIDLSEVVP